jgi:hypothetical protein
MKHDLGAYVSSVWIVLIAISGRHEPERAKKEADAIDDNRYRDNTCYQPEKRFALQQRSPVCSHYPA